MPQGLTPNLRGSSSHTYCLAAAKVLHCLADCQVLLLCHCVSLPLSRVLSVFGLYCGTDIALCVAYLHCHEMRRSSYVAIIFCTRPNNLLHLASIQHTHSHTEPQIQSGIMQRCSEHSFDENETHSVCILVQRYHMY